MAGPRTTGRSAESKTSTRYSARAGERLPLEHRPIRDHDRRERRQRQERPSVRRTHQRFARRSQFREQRRRLCHPCDQRRTDRLTLIRGQRVEAGESRRLRNATAGEQPEREADRHRRQQDGCRGQVRSPSGAWARAHPVAQLRHLPRADVAALQVRLDSRSLRRGQPIVDVSFGLVLAKMSLRTKQAFPDDLQMPRPIAKRKGAAAARVARRQVVVRREKVGRRQRPRCELHELVVAWMCRHVSLSQGR